MPGSSCVLPSSKMPVAVNCCTVPTAIVAVAGKTDIEVRCAGTTVRVVESVREPTVAVMVVVPAAKVVALPFASIVAAEGNEEVQVTSDTRSCDDPSL